MKYKLLFIPLFATLLLKCNSKENVINDDYCHYELTEPLFGIVDSFIQTNKNKDWRLYELYIDKMLPNRTMIILAATNKSVIKDENTKPAMYTEVNGTQVNIYSGIEKFVVCEQDFIKTSEIKHTDRISSQDRVYWVVTDSIGSFMINTEYMHLHPFGDYEFLSEREHSRLRFDY